MFSPPSSPSVLASTSRHNIIRQHATLPDQKSIRLFLGHDSDMDDEDVYDDDGHVHSHMSASSRSQLALDSRPASPRMLNSPGKKLGFVSKPVSSGVMMSPSKRQKTFLVRGNVTPSRAFSIFRAAKQRKRPEDSHGRHGMMTPPSSSPLESLTLVSRREEGSPSKRSLRMSSSSFLSPSSSLRSGMPSSQSLSEARSSFLSAKPAQRTAFSGTAVMPRAIHSLRAWSSSNLHGSDAGQTTLDTTTFLDTFVSPFTSCHQIASGRAEGVNAHPISAAYSYSSRSVHPSAQWLAVGDDEGRITLVNTLPAQDPSAETYSSHPQWEATPDAAVFELTWRFDDRVLLSGSSDYTIRSWDTEYQQSTGLFVGHTGSPRMIVYDPTTNGGGGCGNVFASAGRDGSIRIWDVRVGPQPCSQCPAEIHGQDPVLSIDAAHSVTPYTKSKRGAKRQMPVRSGVTALAYLPDGNGHKLLSGGSSNAVVKCWDLRKLSPDTALDTDLEAIQPSANLSNAWTTPDLSLLAAGLHRRPHGLSQIIASSTHLYASCTGGRVYVMPLASFLDRQFDASGMQTLYDPVQCQNTLFSRMSLFNDQFLAVGCNSGDVALWNVQHAQTTSSRGKDEGRDLEEERHNAGDLDMGIGYPSQHSNAVILTGGHASNTEVNAVAWSNGPNGPTLSSVGDDTNVRSWYPDRALRRHMENPQQ